MIFFPTSLPWKQSSICRKKLFKTNFPLFHTLKQLPSSLTHSLCVALPAILGFLTARSSKQQHHTLLAILSVRSVTQKDHCTSIRFLKVVADHSSPPTLHLSCGLAHLALFSTLMFLTFKKKNIYFILFLFLFLESSILSYLSRQGVLNCNFFFG